MSKTCEKCGYENSALPKAAVCPKCLTPYGARTAARALPEAGAPRLQVAGAGGAAMPVGGVSPLRARIGVLVMLGLVAMGIGTCSTNRERKAAAAVEAQRAQAARVADAIAQRRVLIGMSADQVREAWGEPTSINETIRAGLNSQQWVYRRSGWTNAQFVYLDNGVVRSIQTVQ